MVVFKAYGRAQAQIIECANETFSAIRTVRNDFPTADAVVSCQTLLLLLPMRLSFQGGYMWSWPSVLMVCYLSLSYAGGGVVRVNIPSSSFIFKDCFSMERLFTQCLHALCDESSFFLQSHTSISAGKVIWRREAADKQVWWRGENSAFFWTDHLEM